MTKKNISISIETLLEKCKRYIKSDEQIEIINYAYEYALKYHDGEYRKNGDLVINHLLSVAVILTDINTDYETISAALLHEIMSNGDIDKNVIEEKFGSNISFLVDGVTRITKLHFSTENEAVVEYYKKIIVGMSEDVRVIIIKLADRLDNMRTLWALPKNTQKKKARETIEILTPIAHHLGIHKLKSEMEDLSLRYLKPDVFYDIAEKLNNTKLERDEAVNDMIQNVSNLLNQNGIKHEIKGRSKSIYSIYKKLEKGRKFSDIYDLLALRVFVNTEQECYTALGIIHSKFRPLPKRFKDYIAMPKPNMYQSLHTTVFGIGGDLFEIQIRTYDMDEVAENGIAAHWSYKENKGSNVAADLQNTTEQKLQFLLLNYFGFDLAAEPCPLVKEAAVLLPFVNRWRGDLGFVANLLGSLMNCRVEMSKGRYSHIDTTRCWLPVVRYKLLIPGLTSEAYKEYMQNLKPLVAFLEEWFVPFDVRCEIDIKEHRSESRLPDDSLTLNYNTELNQ